MPNSVRKAESGVVDVGAIACPVSIGLENDNENKTKEERRMGSKNTKAGSKYRAEEEAYSELNGSHRVGSKRRVIVG